MSEPPATVWEMSDLIALRPGARKPCRRARSAAELYSLGCALEATDPGAATEAYRRAILARPTLGDAHCNLARLHHEAGDLAHAEAGYRRAIACDPAVALYHYNLGVALEDQRRDAEAITAYEAALGLAPGLAEAHYNLAGLLGRRGDDEAMRGAVRHLVLYRALRRVG